MVGHQGDLDNRVQTALSNVGHHIKLATSHCLIRCSCSVGHTVRFRSSDWHSMPEHAGRALCQSDQYNTALVVYKPAPARWLLHCQMLDVRITVRLAERYLTRGLHVHNNQLDYIGHRNHCLGAPLPALTAVKGVRQQEQLGLWLLTLPARLRWGISRLPATCKQSTQSCGLLPDSRGANVVGTAVPYTQLGRRSAHPVGSQELCTTLAGPGGRSACCPTIAICSVLVGA